MGTNWSAVAAVISSLTFILLLVGGGVLWGTLTEKVAGLTKRADGHKAEIVGLGTRLNAHDVEIAKLIEWKAGYNAAASLARHTSEIP